MSTSEHFFATGHKNGDLKLWNISDKKCMTTMNKLHDEIVTCVKYLPGENQLLTTSKDHSIKLVDLRMQKEVLAIEHNDYYNSF
mgnify:CR=1 FL=1